MTSRHYYRCLQVYENLRLGFMTSDWSTVEHNGLVLVENQFETYAKSEGSGTFCDNISDADIMYAIPARTRFQ